MTRLTGHFDGRVIVPAEPVNLPKNEELVILVETTGKTTTLQGMLELARRLNFSEHDLAEMNRAIEHGCERVDPNDW